jgi:hypothetical protein
MKKYMLDDSHFDGLRECAACIAEVRETKISRCKTYDVPNCPDRNICPGVTAAKEK